MQSKFIPARVFIVISLALLFSISILWTSLPFWISYTDYRLTSTSLFTESTYRCDPNTDEGTPMNCVTEAYACTLDGACSSEKIALFHGILGNYLSEDPVSNIEYIERLFDGLDPKISTVCFSSRGGFSRFSQDMITFLRKNKFNTCVAEQYVISDTNTGGRLTIQNSECSSNCVPVLIFGSDKRYALGSELNVVIHRYFTLRTSSSSINIPKECGWIPYFPVWPHSDKLFGLHNDCTQESTLSVFNPMMIRYPNSVNSWRFIKDSILKLEIDVDLTLDYNTLQAEELITDVLDV